jgi:hypothetical protein
LLFAVFLICNNTDFMSVVTPHRASETGFLNLLAAVRPHDDSEPMPEHLRTSRLTVDDYEKLLQLWITWPGYRRDESKVFRENFIRRIMTNDAPLFREVIAIGIRKLPEYAREDIESSFDMANSDPLMYLNLCGVPPITILAILDETNGRRKRILAESQNVRDFELKTARRIALLKRQGLPAAELKLLLQKSENDLTALLASTAAAIGLPRKLNSKAKRRVPIDSEFNFAVNQLVAECYSEVTSKAGQEWQEWDSRECFIGREPDRRTAVEVHWTKSLLPTITCLMIAAWPDWFRSASPENSLRKVKACWPKTLKGRNRKEIILLPDYPDPLSVRTALDFIHDLAKYEPPVR